jgi:hypothetical protein
MKRYNLFKTSAPGWELRGAGIKMVIDLLEEHTCKICIEDETDVTLKGYTEVWLNELRGTCCACEFVVETEPDNFLDRLELEYDELVDKSHDLKLFLENPQSVDVSEWEYTMMKSQLHAMESYSSALLSRIAHHNKV